MTKINSTEKFITNQSIRHELLIKNCSGKSTINSSLLDQVTVHSDTQVLQFGIDRHINTVSHKIPHKILMRYINSTLHVYLHAKYLRGLAQRAEAQLAFTLLAKAKMPTRQQKHACLT